MKTIKEQAAKALGEAHVAAYYLDRSIVEACGIGEYDLDDDALHKDGKIFIGGGHTWQCTYEEVGTHYYFLDSVLVAMTTQAARKSDVVTYFPNQRAFERLWNYLKQFEVLDEYDKPKFFDLDKTEGDYLNY